MTQQMIKSVAAALPSQVTILGRTGKHTRVDLAEYLDSPGNGKLWEPAFFTNAMVEEWGHGIEWGDGEIGIDADTRFPFTSSLPASGGKLFACKTRPEINLRQPALGGVPGSR